MTQWSGSQVFTRDTEGLGFGSRFQRRGCAHLTSPILGRKDYPVPLGSQWLSNMGS